MIFAVSIGNTNIKIGIGYINSFEKLEILIDDINSQTDFIYLIEKKFGNNIWEELDGSIVVSVVPRKTKLIENAIFKKTGIHAKNINSCSFGNFKLQDYLGNLGEDRIVCCISALSRYGSPFMLVDFGTATTLNIVGENGLFLGGAILTGVIMGLKALSKDAAQLGEIEIKSKVNIIGKGTEENLVSGAVMGAVYSVKGYLNAVEKELGCPVPVIVTGGNASLVIPYFDFKYIYEPDLLLHGLFRIYNI